MKKKYLSEQFCQGLLDLNLPRSKALANLVMALSSYCEGKSLVELSLSPLFHHQYSSIFKCIADLYDSSKEGASYEKECKKIQDYCLRYAKSQKRVRLQTDVTPLFREYSPSLKDRQYVKKSNTVIKGNKPIGVGYPLSSIHLSCESKWSIPLVRNRVPLSHTESSFAVAQLQVLLPELRKALGFDLVINTSDSSYTHASYLSPLYEYDDLVCISRFRYGTKIYAPLKEELPLEGAKPKSGAPKIYGDCFYLRDATRTIQTKAPTTGKTYQKEQISIHELPYDEQITFDATTQKGKAIRVELYRWNDVKIRSKNKKCMKHKAFDVVAVKVFNTKTNKRLFKRDLFFSIFGKRKQEVSLEEAHQDYRHRYDIEPAFRFNKQQLFLDSYLCEEVQHLDNFLLINQLANWLLYVAADEVSFIPKKWEKKVKVGQEKEEKLSIAKTRRATQTLFLTFDPTPFLPKSAKKGKGRIKQKRVHYSIVRKTKKQDKKQAVST